MSGVIKKAISKLTALNVLAHVLIYIVCVRETFGQKNASHLGGEAYQMFSQRNNPYCELLQFCIANV